MRRTVLITGVFSGISFRPLTMPTLMRRDFLGARLQWLRTLPSSLNSLVNRKPRSNRLWGKALCAFPQVSTKH
jgi:hypothetical protein